MATDLTTPRTDARLSGGNQHCLACVMSNAQTHHRTAVDPLGASTLAPAPALGRNAAFLLCASTKLSEM
jgi:hypothetical protein